MRIFYLFVCLYLTSCSSKTEIIEKYADGKPKKVIEHYQNDSTCEKSYHVNGKLKEIKCLLKGKQTGEQIFFRQDGTKSAVMTFRNGIRQGKTFEFYPSGQVAFEGVVENGEFEGVSIACFVRLYWKKAKISP